MYIPQAAKRIVVARYKENINWLRDISPCWQIIIYNKGPNDIGPLLASRPDFIVINYPNVGRESHTYARHISENYSNLADITIFTQGDPFPHAPEFLQCIAHLESTPPARFYPMTIQYLPRIPAQNITRNRPDRFFRYETMSTSTLNSIYFNDTGTAGFSKGYARFNGLPYGTNLMAHLFRYIGLPNHIPEDKTTMRFSYAACFAATKQAILANPIATYQTIAEYSCKDSSVGYLIERAWVALFDLEAALNTVNDTPVTQPASSSVLEAEEGIIHIRTPILNSIRKTRGRILHIPML